MLRCVLKRRLQDIVDAVDYGFPEGQRRNRASTSQGSRGYIRKPTEGNLSNYNETGLMPPWAQRQELDKVPIFEGIM